MIVPILQPRKQALRFKFLLMLMPLKQLMRAFKLSEFNAFFLHFIVRPQTWEG